MEPITDDLINRYRIQRETNPRYRGAHLGWQVVRDIFNTHPSHTDIKDVLTKTAVLNDLYHTHLTAPVQMATHICDLPTLTHQIQSGDPVAVMHIADLSMPRTHDEDIYIFASKYCFFTRPDTYFIYDPMVKKMISDYLKLSDTEQDQLRQYDFFQAQMNRLIQTFHLHCTHRDLDIFLWTRGKERT